MRKQSILISAAAICSVLLFSACNGQGNTLSLPSDSAASESSDTSEVDILAALPYSPELIGEKDGVKIIRYRETAEEYTISVLYGALKITEADAAIKEAVFGIVNEFKDSVSQTEISDGEETPWLTIKYNQYRYNENIITLKFEVNERIGNTHSHHSFTFCINTSTGEQIALADVLDLASARDFLAAEGTKQICSKYTTLTEEETAAVLASLLTESAGFYLEEESITLVFDPHHFGLDRYGYAFEVTVTFDDLGNDFLYLDENASDA